ncbi:hypothetical protein [Burkholderia sp. F1]|uniref:hypothetical protein n=1 Tax=Burkholderia sp. F1 TaxID=3366817 RepID=UPI003D70F55D
MADARALRGGASAAGLRGEVTSLYFMVRYVVISLVPAAPVITLLRHTGWRQASSG